MGSNPTPSAHFRRSAGFYGELPLRSVEAADRVVRNGLGEHGLSHLRMAGHADAAVLVDRLRQEWPRSFAVAAAFSPSCILA